MHLPTLLSLISSALLALALAQTTGTTTTITLRIPATHALPNPNSLPPSTSATLTSLGHSLSAPLSTSNTFVFHNVSSGSYLVDVHCASLAFIPLRLDVDVDAAAGGMKTAAWETYRGNGWDNKGEAVPVGEGVGYFMERSKFNVLSILKNPMILLGMVSMAIFIGMPYLVDNMDPEMRAEWEERQKTNPMNGIMGAATGTGSANPVGNFDMAAFLAGSSSKKGDDGGAGAASLSDSAPPPASASGSGSGNNGGGSKKKRRG
ncbi:hypothetical protein B0T19DRAFT_431379 [Cercophora scortea]|uniref:ER membrane protein complex subunit 7 beta-sandwich domain-containing protein n=1 Tax=Cercophora scortea TaxID=314031 RepID=A0AAE0I9Y7_9PEZI|nr:hypothetical protein B0T19DRAFT_431379 [Cercophora scortea]